MVILDTHAHTHCPFNCAAVINQKKCLYLWAEVRVPLEAVSTILIQLVDNGHKHSAAMWYRTDPSGGSGPVSHDEYACSDYYDNRTICTTLPQLYEDETNRQTRTRGISQRCTCSIIGRDELLRDKWCVTQWLNYSWLWPPGILFHWLHHRIRSACCIQKIFID